MAYMVGGRIVKPDESIDTGSCSIREAMGEEGCVCECMCMCVCVCVGGGLCGWVFEWVCVWGHVSGGE